MKKFFFVIFWVVILPFWAVFAILHTAAALLTKGLFYFEDLLGNLLDEMEWKAKKISLEKDK